MSAMGRIRLTRVWWSATFGLQDQVSGALQLWEATRESQTVDGAENWFVFSENFDCHAFIFTLLDDTL